MFLETAKRSHNYNQYALILETGLRTGEMIGLTWDAIDFEKRTHSRSTKYCSFDAVNSIGVLVLRKRSTATAQYR